MGTAPPDEPLAAKSIAVATAIKRTALGALVAGGVCLYFGFTWLLDTPRSASAETTDTWLAFDHVFRWGLRLTGLTFLVVAALAWTGARAAALLATIVEGVFALLMLAMAVETFLETRADGQLDVIVILLLIMTVVGLSAAKHSWSLYGRSRRPPATQ